MGGTPPFDFVAQNGYDHSFFACFMDPLWCLATCFCPCLVIGRVKGVLDGTSFDILSCLCPLIATYRNRRRIQDLYNHHESEDGSMCATVCCNCCAVTQDAHEVVARQPGKPAEAAPVAVEQPTV
jgi:Cys-rich protein (TIGR01571 family)